jgi:hypothetical protein
VSRLPASLAREIGARDSITIRVSHEGDADRLERLAGLAGTELPEGGGLIVAESDDELIAALSLRTGRVISDPFHVTSDLVALLRVRAAQLERLAA